MGMKRLIFVICAILCSSLFVSAKDFREVVYLKNGSIIKGIILEQIPNETIKIETSDGSVWVFQMSEVLKITKEFSSRNSTMRMKNRHGERDEFKTNGYKGFVDVGGAFGVGTYGDGLVSVSSTHGYQFNPYFFLGVGVGVNYHFNWSTVFIPVYADARGYFMNNDIAPFIGLKVGYSVFDGMGFYFNPSVGVRFIATSKLGLNLSIGFIMQRTDITFRQYYYNPRTHDSYVNSYDERNTIGGVMFKLGFEF